ncbi:TetR/AcrR family transcriptional regulator [Labrenzia sp. R4_2]|uniref:TetR/AcrR family transcriptional regulator n=1 Tax=Labrenzia sp. R4_2 TaxID=2821107 RepID=UPI001ADC7134|nr:TetR/AcrR family transcriptional regulator [Labrenzia sp. R4_2]MBO9418501.1 TetR/AcrR family transcriptional regulator [Labrenzia sp. R4_2]
MSRNTRRYHHGDLRATLVKQAITALDREPDSEITLRHLAKVVGVSPMAPYAHFEDKDALMDAVAIEGFCWLETALTSALEPLGESDDTESVLAALAGAYVAFGVARPGLYRVMFARPAKPHGDPVRNAGERAFQPLQNVFAQKGADARQSAEIAWSFVHGLTLLAVKGFIETVELPERQIKAACRMFAKI